MKSATKSQLFFWVITALAFLMISVRGEAQLTSGSSQQLDPEHIQQDTMRTKGEIIRFFKEDTIVTRGPTEDIQHSRDRLRLAVPFDFNSAGLTSAAKQQLDFLGSALESPEISDVYIELAGHTDERGTREYNLDLSQRRVQSAKNYLLANFTIDASRIIEAGYGESRPIIPNARSEAEHAANRRVEIRPLREAAPHPESEGLSLHWGILHVIEEDEYELISYDGTSVLRSGDRYRIYVHPGTECYVYMYQVDSKAKGSWLFPRDDLLESNPVSPRDYWIPSRNSVFTLDQTVGIETIYIVASRHPAYDLDELIASVEEVPSDVVTQRIETRGLGEIRVGSQSSQGVEESVQIYGNSHQSKSGLRTDEPPRIPDAISGHEIAELFSRFGEFHRNLKFAHER
jgi:outer membrane protein OmpA-like peptidoglycan-associated protein